MTKPNIAIVGTGIAGLGVAHELHSHANLTLFEKNNYVGGHTNTVTVNTPNGPLGIDTGFMVFNNHTYPNLCALFKSLNVPYQNTTMSFSVCNPTQNIEWNGAGFSKLFAQRRNLFRPRFWRMLMQMDRFNKEALSAFQDPQYAEDTVETYLAKRGFGNDFLNLFLIPMTAAIWSASPEQVLAFPIWTLLRFFYNHGFLGLHGHYQWYTVTGGAQTYIQKLIPPFSNRIRLNTPVTKIEQQAHTATVQLADGTTQTFDKVILASHGDETLKLLSNPTPLQEELLKSFQYSKNRAQLHTDPSVMPKRKPCWAAWNYRIDESQRQSPGESKASTHYWMNCLHQLKEETQYFVSINGQHQVDPAKVIQEIQYEHPIYSLAAIQSQKRLPELNQVDPQQSVYFCGSYFKYGFHEDAYTSALTLGQQLSQQLTKQFRESAP